jgi:hypothetical protein
MSDDEQLRRLLDDAAADIHPRDRLPEIRASVRSARRPATSTPRPWLYAAAGAVASVAVIGIVAYTTSVLSGPDAHGPGYASDGGPDPAPTTITATDPSASHATTPTSAPTQGPQSYAVYYVGANGAERPVLFREVHQGPQLESADPSGNGHDVLTEAVQDALNTFPTDPGYRTPWRGLVRLDYASYTTTGAGYTLQIALHEGAPVGRPSDMTAAEARAAVQQLVYTAQAAIGKRVPVTFTIGTKVSGPHTLLGIDISRPIASTPVLSTLSRINITSPVEDAPVSGRLTVRGVNSSVGGHLVVTLVRNDHTYLTQPGTGGSGHRLSPWTVHLDLSQVPAGQYTLVATNGDRRPHGGPDTDTRTLEVK